MAYAEGTSVAVDKSMGEIMGLLRKAGADRLAQSYEPERLAIQCFLNGRLLRFVVQLPGIETIPGLTANYRSLTESQRAEKLYQRHRHRARALLLVVKAKLESVESGVETFDEAFLANVVMADGETVAQKTLPQISHAYETGQVTPLMLTRG